MSTMWSIRDRAGFDRVRTTGRSAKVRHLAVNVVVASDGLPVRLGMAVGKPVGGAVQRNLVRRRLRAIVAEVADQMSGTMVVIRAFPGAADVSFAELRLSVQRALAQAHPSGAGRAPSSLESGALVP